MLNIKWNALPVYDKSYIKTEKKYGDKVYTNFCSLNVPKDGVEYEFYTIVSIDSLLISKNKYYLQVYLETCAYKIVETQSKW